MKRNSTELSKNVDKCEKENSKQIENLNGKVSILEKSVNTQIPKELSKIESMQKMISENEKSVSTLKKSLDANGQEVEKLKTKVGQVSISANQFLKQLFRNTNHFADQTGVARLFCLRAKFQSKI